jgi:hypothetical protein
VSHDYGLEAKPHITTNSEAGVRHKALIPHFAGFNQVYDRWGLLSGARWRCLHKIIYFCVPTSSF